MTQGISLSLLTSLRARLASILNGEGCSLIGIEDAGGYFTANNIQAALDEINSLIGGANNISRAFTTWSLSSTGSVSFAHGYNGTPKIILGFFELDNGGSPTGGTSVSIGWYQNNIAGSDEWALAFLGRGAINNGYIGISNSGFWNPPTPGANAHRLDITSVDGTDITVNRSNDTIIGGVTVRADWYSL